MARDQMIGAVHRDVSPRRGEGPCEAPARAPMEVEGRIVRRRSGFVVVRELGATEPCSRESPQATRPPTRSATPSPAGPFPPPGGHIRHAHRPERYRAPTGDRCPANSPPVGHTGRPCRLLTELPDRGAQRPRVSTTSRDSAWCSDEASEHIAPTSQRVQSVRKSSIACWAAVLLSGSGNVSVDR